MKKAVLALILVMLILPPCVFAEKPEGGEFERTGGCVTAYFGGEVVSVPPEIDGVKITEIGEKFCFDQDVSTLYIAEGIEKIGESAFEGTNLTNADIPASVKAVGVRAFANCAELADVVINSDAAEFSDGAFEGCGYINFAIPCMADEAVLQAKITAAKGDDSFCFTVFHTKLAESMEEKDIFGENMIYCEACGFKGSRYADNFEVPFEDVPEDAWYYAYVGMSRSMGIISGKSETVFDPNAGLTCAEAAKIAACIYAREHGNGEDFTHTGGRWYDVYLDYCYKNGIIEDYITLDWDKNATRAEVAYLFSRCSGGDAINNVPITDIPDVYDTTPFAYEILDLYNKGIAVGSNEYYAYYPDSEVKRSEAAALIARIMVEDMRIELPKG